MSNKSTQFKPGQSGNPKGRPKRDWTWAGLIEKALEEKDKNGTPIKEIVTKALVVKAATGDVVALKEVGNRIDGLPAQNVNMNQSGEISVKWKDANDRD